MPDLQVRQKLMLLKLDELKEVAANLGLARSGRKADLQQRLLVALGEEGAAGGDGLVLRRGLDPCRVQAAHKLIDQLVLCQAGGRGGHGGAAAQAAADGPLAGRKRQRTPDVGGPVWGSANGSMLDLLDLPGAGALNTVVRCVCRDTSEQPAMAQCAAPGCGVWQHLSCMPRRMMQLDAVPPPYYCDRCRVARADPFWEMFDTTVLLPQRVVVSGAQGMDGTLTQSTPPALFTLTQQQMTLLQMHQQDYRLQAVCIQASDAVPFRIHWPMYSDLRCNGNYIQAHNRGGGTKMGINGRDNAINLLPFVSPGRHNTISLTCKDRESGFVLLVYIARKRTLQQVKALMKAQDSLEAAVQRVVRVLQGDKQTPATAANGAAGSDSDDDITLVNNVVSLTDPLTGTRIAMPARFTDTNQGLVVFDLDPFLTMAERTRKWLDPHNGQPSTVQMLQVDAYLAAILRCLQHRPGVSEVEVDPEGRWRPAGSGESYKSVLDHAAMAEAAAEAASSAQRRAGEAVSLSDSDEDAEEELRQAAAAVRSQRPTPAPASAPAVEVIDLISDSEDEAASPAAASPAAATAPAARPSSSAPGQQQQQQQRQQQAVGSNGAQPSGSAPATGAAALMKGAGPGHAVGPGAAPAAAGLAVGPGGAALQLPASAPRVNRGVTIEASGRIRIKLNRLGNWPAQQQHQHQQQELPGSLQPQGSGQLGQQQQQQGSVGAAHAGGSAPVATAGTTAVAGGAGGAIKRTSSSGVALPVSLARSSSGLGGWSAGMAAPGSAGAGAAPQQLMGVQGLGPAPSGGPPGLLIPGRVGVGVPHPKGAQQPLLQNLTLQPSLQQQQQLGARGPPPGIQVWGAPAHHPHQQQQQQQPGPWASYPPLPAGQVPQQLVGAGYVPSGAGGQVLPPIITLGPALPGRGVTSPHLQAVTGWQQQQQPGPGVIQLPGAPEVLPAVPWSQPPPAAGSAGAVGGQIAAPWAVSSSQQQQQTQQSQQGAAPQEGQQQQQTQQTQVQLQQGEPAGQQQVGAEDGADFGEFVRTMFPLVE